MNSIKTAIGASLVGVCLHAGCSETTNDLKAGDRKSVGGEAGASDAGIGGGAASGGSTASGGTGRGGSATRGGTGGTRMGEGGDDGPAGDGGASAEGGEGGASGEGGSAGATTGGAGRGGMGGNAGASEGGGAGGAAGMSGAAGMTCVPGVWNDCPPCPGSAPVAGGCSIDPQGPRACSWESGPSSGTCVCVVTGSGIDGTWSCNYACDTVAPPQGSACEYFAIVNDRCVYANQTCTCQATGTWNCGCPLAEPADTSDCTNFEGFYCDYDTRRCHCDETSKTWECLGCPTDEPTHDGDCTGSPRRCDYPGAQCLCDPYPTTETWACQIDCPEPPPIDSEPCNGVSDWCPSNDEQCRCDTASKTWECVACGASAPDEGSACTGLGDLFCPYYDLDCWCDASDETWACDVHCPDPLTGDGTTCSAVNSGLFCVYPSPSDPNPFTCVCDPNVGQWRCLDCPASSPDGGDACPGFYGRICQYPNERCTCDTTSGNWDCAVCPSTPPTSNTSCTGLARLSCQYGSTNCRCNGGTLLWTCN